MLSPTAAIIDYAIVLEKQSANRRVFVVVVGVQMEVGLQQTTENISGASFITAEVAYASTKKTQIV